MTQITTYNNSTKFNMTRDISGYNGFGVDFAKDNYRTTLAANVEQHFTVPSNYPTFIAIFTYTAGANVWVANNKTATVAGGSFASSFSQLNPAARRVFAGDVLSFITGDSTNPFVEVSLYVCPPFTN